jgi:hypothetical protein
METARTLRDQYAHLEALAAEQNEKRDELYALAKRHQAEADRLDAEAYAAEQLAFEYEEQAARLVGGQ